MHYVFTSFVRQRICNYYLITLIIYILLLSYPYVSVAAVENTEVILKKNDYNTHISIYDSDKIKPFNHTNGLLLSSPTSLLMNNATMTRITIDKESCFTYTDMNHYNEQYNVSIFDYSHTNNETPEHDLFHLNAIRLLLPPKQITSLCNNNDEIIDTIQWLNNVTKTNVPDTSTNLSNTQLEHVMNCDNNNSMYYYSSLLIHPSFMIDNNTNQYCSLSTILSNVNKINNYSNSNKTVTTIILTNEILMILNKTEYETLMNNTSILDNNNIRIVFVPYHSIIEMDNVIHNYYENYQHIMSPYYLDQLSNQWNLSYGFIDICNNDIDSIADSTSNTTSSNNTTANTTDVNQPENVPTIGMILIWSLFCISFCLIFIYYNNKDNNNKNRVNINDNNIINNTIQSNHNRNIAITTNNPSTTTTTDATADKANTESRKHDFDTLPKIYYHHKACSFRKRKLMMKKYLRSISASKTIKEECNEEDNNDYQVVDENQQVFEQTTSNQRNSSNIDFITNQINQICESNFCDSIHKDTHDDIENNKNELSTETNLTINEGSLLRLPSLLYKSSISTSSLHNSQSNCGLYDNIDTSTSCNTDDVCCICFDEYTSNEIVIVLPQCHHMYHVSCLQQWFIDKQSNLCPLCNTEIIIPYVPNNDDDEMKCFSC